MLTPVVIARGTDWAAPPAFFACTQKDRQTYLYVLHSLSQILPGQVNLNVHSSTPLSLPAAARYSLRARKRALGKTLLLQYGETGPVVWFVRQLCSG